MEAKYQKAFSIKILNFARSNSSSSCEFHPYVLLRSDLSPFGILPKLHSKIHQRNYCSEPPDEVAKLAKKFNIQYILL